MAGRVFPHLAGIAGNDIHAHIAVEFFKHEIGVFELVQGQVFSGKQLNLQVSAAFEAAGLCSWSTRLAVPV